MFSTRLSSGHFGGSGMRVIFGGTTRRVDQVSAGLIDQEDGVGTRLTVLALSTRRRFIVSVLQAGRIRAAPLPCFGQTAPKM
jgi:hypothetical protein